MSLSFSTLTDIFTHDFDTVIDVRSPSEFADDHLPGAINLPVLDDAERAEVGRIYVQESPFKARKIGAALVAKNAAVHLQGPLFEKDGSWQPLVYCWRGGQRSGSFASILSQIGWRVELLEGGYRSYRRMVVNALYNEPFRPSVYLLDGYTGSAKTEILSNFERLGGQIIDLEGLANHRGSVFGGLLDAQPSQKAFEGALALAISGLDEARPVLIEAESSKVGERLVPPSLWSAMKDAPRIRVTAPVKARAEYLTRTYVEITQDPQGLQAILVKLRPFFSVERMDELEDLALGSEFEALAAALMDEHYDPRYRKSAASPEVSLDLNDLSAASIAGAARKIWDQLSCSVK